MKTTNILFEVVGEDSDLCGEEFFVQVQYEDGEKKCDIKARALEIANQYFEGEKLRCGGFYTDNEAEWYGLDTY